MKSKKALLTIFSIFLFAIIILIVILFLQKKTVKKSDYNDFTISCDNHIKLENDYDEDESTWQASCSEIEPTPEKCEWSLIITNEELKSHLSITDSNAANCTITLSPGLGVATYTYNLCLEVSGENAHTKKVTSRDLEIEIIPETHYNMDGTNWLGYESGTLTMTIDGTNAKITGNSSYTATNLIIPKKVWDDNDDSYTVTEIAGGFGNQLANIKGTLTFRNGLTTIGAYAFYNNRNLTGVKFSNSITKIDVNAFYNCTALTGNLILPNSLLNIGASAFGNCTALTGNLILPNSLLNIGMSAFNSCNSLNGTLTLPSSLSSIGSTAFQFCNFTSITNNVGQIGTDLYIINLNPSGTAKGVFDTPSFSESSKVIGCCAFGTDVDLSTYSITEIADGAFNGCSGLKGHLILPNNLVTIGKNAFNYCNGLVGTLTLPSSLTTIDNNAFFHCSGLNGTLTLPNNLATIGANAFVECFGFSGLTLPNTLTTIGNDAFNGCKGFSGSLIIPDSITSIQTGIFNNCIGFDGSLTLPHNLNQTSTFPIAFANCNFTSITNNTGQIGTDLYIINLNPSGTAKAIINTPSFDNTSKIVGKCAFGTDVDLSITSSVTEIAQDAFNGCKGLKGELKLPNTLQIIKENAFSECSSFTSLAPLPNTLTEIETTAFYGCSNMSGTLTLPSSLTTIGGRAFYHCSSFTSISANYDSYPTFTDTGAFYDWGENGTVSNSGSISSADLCARFKQYAWLPASWTGA